MKIIILQKFKEKLLKRTIIAIIGLFVSIIIWDINSTWGNTFNTCLSLSITTFLLIYIPFEIYWSFWDIWFDRWIYLYSKYLETSKIKIIVSDGKFLSTIIIKSKDVEKKISKNAIIIINHGFSDTKESLQYYYLPLALQGYVILAYDARGTGGSKKAGNKRDFLKRIEDHDSIIKWIKNNDEFKNKKIYSVGFSIGAIVSLCSGFSNNNIQKIIAISAVSDYRKNSPKFNPLILLYYLLKGVNLHPNKEKNFKLSPYLQFQNIKKETTKEEWIEMRKKVLLIHSKNDRVIKLKNFIENIEILNLPENNQVSFRKGGHSLKKNEIELVGASLKFLSD